MINPSPRRQRLAALLLLGGLAGGLAAPYFGLEPLARAILRPPGWTERAFEGVVIRAEGRVAVIRTADGSGETIPRALGGMDGALPNVGDRVVKQAGVDDYQRTIEGSSTQQWRSPFADGSRPGFVYLGVFLALGGGPPLLGGLLAWWLLCPRGSDDLPILTAAPDAPSEPSAL